jgi:hypothetical protein
MASRVAWFVAGGLAASWFFIHKDVPSNHNNWGYCIRKPVQPLHANDARRSVNWHSDPDDWEHEKEKMMSMGRQAADAVSPIFHPPRPAD